MYDAEMLIWPKRTKHEKCFMYLKKHKNNSDLRKYSSIWGRLESILVYKASKKGNTIGMKGMGKELYILQNAPSLSIPICVTSLLDNF